MSHPISSLGPTLERLIPPDTARQHEMLDEPSFLRMLSLERKRAERSQRRFVLMLLECEHLLNTRTGEDLFEKILLILSQSTRETDIKGWYHTKLVVGVIFTELGEADGRNVAAAILSRLTASLATRLSVEQVQRIAISFHVFPDDLNSITPGSPLYPELRATHDQKPVSRFIKRGIDVAGSVLALLFMSPLIVIIAILIKLTSRGPVLFRQKRVGQYERPFTFLKFRSMYSVNDPEVHKDYTKRLITGSVVPGDSAHSHRPVYKLTNDPRITRIGRILRRTSLDEVPQFLNVLKGDMSLVGPRPPVSYEFDCYSIWHRRRLLSVKPGITGLWQVCGRSRVTFDDMVRLDLRYATAWSLSLDISLLLLTPRAVISGTGAY